LATDQSAHPNDTPCWIKLHLHAVMLVCQGRPLLRWLNEAAGILYCDLDIPAGYASDLERTNRSFSSAGIVVRTIVAFSGCQDGHHEALIAECECRHERIDPGVSTSKRTPKLYLDKIVLRPDLSRPDRGLKNIR